MPYSDLLQSSYWGILRGIAVETLTYPLDVIKTRQQCSKEPFGYIQIIKQLYQENGHQAFFRGLSLQLFRVSIKQAWVWPMMTQIPCTLSQYQVHGLSQQIMTGLSIATVDAFITTPFEKLKIRSQISKQELPSLHSIYAEGWHGLSAYWTKRSINMVTFLTTQQYFRESYRQGEERLGYLDLIKTGCQVAFIVSLIGGPFDLANTVKQAHNIGLSHITKYGVARLYRGWPLNALSLIMQNVASVSLLEALTRP